MTVLRIWMRVSLAALFLYACGPSPSGARLEWCAANADEVGRSAVELGLFGNELTYSDWKESRPDEYERACIHAFETAV